MKISLITRSALQTVLSLGLLLSIAAAADVPVRRLTLDDGFHLLYNLDFADAHQVSSPGSKAIPMILWVRLARRQGCYFPSSIASACSKRNSMKTTRRFRRAKSSGPIPLFATASTRR